MAPGREHSDNENESTTAQPFPLLLLLLFYWTRFCYRVTRAKIFIAYMSQIVTLLQSLFEDLANPLTVKETHTTQFTVYDWRERAGVKR